MQQLEVKYDEDMPAVDNMTWAMEKPRTVLVVEDDLAQRPLWERVFQMKGQFTLDWATNMAEAEELIRERFKLGSPYDLVISDIMLEGEGSGIELWNRYGEEVKKFVFVSALPLTKYEIFMSIDFGSPELVKKPLTVKKCMDITDLVSE